MACQHHKEIKLWILDHDQVPQAQMEQFIQSSIADLESLWKRLISEDSIYDFSGSCAAEEHYSQLKGVADDLLDIKYFITRSNNNGFNKIANVDSIMNDYKGIPKLRSTQLELEQLAKFEIEFNKNEKALYDLQTPESEKMISDYERRCYEIQADGIPTWPSHPAFSVINKKLEDIKRTRRDISEKLSCFKYTETIDELFNELDSNWTNLVKGISAREVEDVPSFLNKLKANIENVNLRNKEELCSFLDCKSKLHRENEEENEINRYHKYCASVNDFSYINWINNELKNLEGKKLDHPSGWISLIQYKEYHGYDAVKRYLANEKNICEKNSNSLNEIAVKINFKFPGNKFVEQIEKAEFNNLYLSFFEWLGMINCSKSTENESAEEVQGREKNKHTNEYQFNLDTMNEIQRLFTSIKTFSEADNLLKEIQNGEKGYRVTSDTSILGSLISTCAKIQEIEKENAEQGDDLSGWRKIQIKIVDEMKMQLWGKINSLGKFLEKILEEDSQWKKAWGGVRSEEENWLSPGFSLFKKREKEPLTLQTKIIQAYQIAPKNIQLLEKIKEYGVSIQGINVNNGKILDIGDLNG